MANEEQLSILKQGPFVWNKWRAEHTDIRINLVRAGLSGASLREANLREVNLAGADLMGTDLYRANLYGASLNGADLQHANLDAAYITESNFQKARMSNTNFANSDLSMAIGLDDVVHYGPSNVSLTTLTLSKGSIPEVFLKGCGLSDADIEYAKLSNPDLDNEEINNILYRIYDIRASQALQISALFISYSHADNEFVDKVGSGLEEKGIRYWRDIHKLKAGRIERQINQAIRQNPTVLLVLSEHSLESDWVEHEVRTARGLEKETGRDVLCPVALDDSWKESKWEKHVMEQVMKYNILDFSAWKNESRFDGMFRRLIDGLELFYKG